MGFGIGDSGFEERTKARERIPTRERILSGERIPTRERILSGERIPTRERILSGERIPARERILARERIPTRERILTRERIPTRESRRIPNPKSRIPPLYAILDRDAAARAGWTLLDLASACLAGGALFFQVRAKNAPGAWLLDAAAAIVERAHAAGALVVVNDRADIARLAGADGVHLGQDDLTPAAAHVILGGRALVGLSTHTPDQIDAALRQPIAYLAIGPVFDTSTKSTGYDAIGLEAVRNAAGRARTLVPVMPIVAIGGITLKTAADVLRAGADSVAVITDLLSGGDPEARVRAYVDRLHV
jgi:thiamine-phosphate pyrophosphorylase